MTEQYGIAEYEGEERFRYVQALEVDESCLECHGDPVGEIDKTGHAKEGWTLIRWEVYQHRPSDRYACARYVENFIRDRQIPLLHCPVIGGVVRVITLDVRVSPLARMKTAFGRFRGSLKVTLDDTRTAKEIGRVMRGFNSMASELQAIYSSLEEQVKDRTSDLTRANEALERQRDDLERLNTKLAKETEFKSNLLSMVNHELRTPLTSIITFSQISRESCLDEQADERAKWEEIEKNAQILLRMINDMLDMARSDSGNISASCEPVDLGDVVASVKWTMAPLAKKYQVGFSTSVAPDVPLVMGDYEKIARMLENLGSNAIKFTPDGGSVRLTVECDEDSGSVLLVMSDTGIGIAPQDQERIFERFVQVDSTSTRKYNGSGLGLALAREYAQLQGYSVRVQSELGCGSTFTVEIPKEAIVGDDDV